ncbi:DUF4401 domain-containing protein [Psychrobacter ciconiae]|uniref:DUF4401 domain-containing protein n=1 Tax=Psychrobacter ciconiae TaxID=1553449 RepID=UPI001919F981|nr:DUF4401 domain-containing protein [Psychrobacter ciconiae]
MTPFDRDRFAEADITASIDKLIDEGLIDPTSSALAQFKAADLQNEVTLEATPWFIQLFFGVCGFFASTLLFVVIALMLMASGIGASFTVFITVALILSGLGYFMLAHVSHDAPFVIGLALSLALGAQGYLLMAFTDYPDNLILQVAALIIIELILTVVMPSFFYRLISSAVMLASLFYLLQLLGLISATLALFAVIFIGAAVFAYPLLSRLPKRFLASGISMLRALKWSSALVFMLTAIFANTMTASFWEFGLTEGSYFIQSYHPVLAQGLLVLVAIVTALSLFRRYQPLLLSPPTLLIVIAIVAVGALSVWASGLLAITLVMIVAFANGERLLQAVSVAALVCYGFWYYYQLDTSLLIKSALLLVLALGCFFLRALIFSPRFKDQINQGGKL